MNIQLKLEAIHKSVQFIYCKTTFRQPSNKCPSPLVFLLHLKFSVTNTVLSKYWFNLYSIFIIQYLSESNIIIKNWINEINSQSVLI